MIYCHKYECPGVKKSAIQKETVGVYLQGF